MFLFILELKKPLVEVTKHRKDVKRKPTHPEYCDYYDQHFDNLKEKKNQITIDFMSYFDFLFQNKNNETFNIYTGIQLYMFQNMFIKDDFFDHIPFFRIFSYW